MDVPPKSVLVTGGAKRVGRAIALRLAEAGFDVAFTYLSSKEEAEKVSQEMHGLGRRCLALRADLTRPAEAASGIFDAVQKEFGRLDALVNSASIYEPDAPAEAASAQVQRLTSIHVTAPLLLARQFERHLRASRGHIVNIVDLMAERPWPKYQAYCASKAGLWNLTLGLARQLAPEVTVNGIAPGVVEWPTGYDPVEKEKYLQRVPLGRAGEPKDVAELVHFLVTAGSYITGQIIRVDGGRSLNG
jgi:pteridine reductase